MKILQVQAEFFPRKLHPSQELKVLASPVRGSTLAMTSKWDQGQQNENTSVFPAHPQTSCKKEIEPFCHLHESGRLEDISLWSQGWSDSISENKAEKT